MLFSFPFAVDWAFLFLIVADVFETSLYELVLFLGSVRAPHCVVFELYRRGIVLKERRNRQVFFTLKEEYRAER
jgi:hypothetical protein